MIDPLSSPLLSDLYEYTMLQAYLEREMQGTAVFEFFVRKLPMNRNFLVAAGLEQALEFLENLSFSKEALSLLAEYFPSRVTNYLENFRFEGEVHAMPEGTICFASEPILRVTAPLPQAQLVESRLMNLLNFETLIASKAARSVLVAPNRLLVDFGLRRAHGAEAGMLAARASFLAGFSGTATVLAGMAYGIPLYGTMAHSFVQAHSSEEEAFERFAASRPGTTILIDTYDTEEAAKKVVELAKKGSKIGAVRLDSGDLALHAARVRKILDAGNLEKVSIFASGNLDEYALEALRDSPISGFGIGTALVTSRDSPYLDCAYKLQEYDGTPCRKRSEGKTTWPGRKQVFRCHDAHGKMQEDMVCLENEERDGDALLLHFMRGGKRIRPETPLSEIRKGTLENYERLPEGLRSLEPSPYPVEISENLKALARNIDIRIG